MSVKTSADKGVTGFLFGHYNDLMDSEVTHSNIFSEDSACFRTTITNNEMERFYVVFLCVTLCFCGMFSLRGKDINCSSHSALYKAQHEIITGPEWD